MILRSGEIRLETTNYCNAHCTICPREKMTRPRAIMPYHHVGTLLRQGRLLGAKTVSLFGYGEPLTDDGIVEKIAMAKRMGYEVIITTNGALLDIPTSYRLIAAGLDKIRFSIHGWGRNYEKVHRGLKWPEVSHKIGEFQKINDVAGHPVEVHISVIPMHGETVEQIVDKWEPGGKVKIRVDHLEIWRPHNWAGNRSYRKVKKEKRTCFRPTSGPIQIDASGKMIVCCFDTDSQMVVGDTYSDKIETILRGKPFEDIRKAHREGNFKGLLCETCDQLNEEQSPLLYSTIDPKCEAGRTSSTKFKLKE